MKKAELEYAEQFPHREDQRPQGAADRGRGAESHRARWRRFACSRRRDDQGEGAAHHPCRPARAQCQARRARAGAAGAARAPAVAPDAGGHRGPTFCTGSTIAGSPLEIFAPDNFELKLSLHRRHAAVPYQHVMRHVDAGTFAQERDSAGRAEVLAAIEEVQRHGASAAPRRPPPLPQPRVRPPRRPQCPPPPRLAQQANCRRWNKPRLRKPVSMLPRWAAPAPAREDAPAARTAKRPRITSSTLM